MINVKEKDNPDAYKKELGKIIIDPVMQIFDSARFSRLMKGRLRFYARSRNHFDSKWLIENELNRIGKSFFANPLAIYWKAIRKASRISPEKIAKKLEGDIFTANDVEAMLAFAELTMHGYKEGEQVSLAEKIADVFDNFYIALDKLYENAQQSPLFLC